MAAAEPVTTLKTPGGIPARSASSASASAENGVCVAGFSTMVQPAASAGPALRVIIAAGKVPRRDGGDHANRLAQHHDALVRLMAGNQIPVEPLALFGEPFDERGGISDLALRFGKRLALLGRHQDREVLLVLRDEIEPAAQ